MTYEQRAIDLAKRLDALPINFLLECSRADEDILGDIGELTGGLTIGGYEGNLKSWLDGRSSDCVNEIVNYSNGNPSAALEEQFYDERYVELAQEWFIAASKLASGLSVQVAA